MRVRHLVLAAGGPHTALLAVLGGVPRGQEVLVVAALPADPDGVAPVDDGEHVLPVQYSSRHHHLRDEDLNMVFGVVWK